MLLNIDSSLRTDSRSCYKRHTWYTEGHKRLLIDRHVPLVVKIHANDGSNISKGWRRTFKADKN